MDTKTLAQCYADLRGARSHFLDRAYECARLTVPSLLTEDGGETAEELASKFNSVGAEAVNSLANKMLLALFPPGQTFFRLRMKPETRRALSKARQDAEQSDPETASEASTEIAKIESVAEAKLAQVELSILREFEAANPRPELYQCLRHLIVAGSSVLWTNDDEVLCVPLSSFVTERAGRRWRKTVLRTFVPIEDLPMGLRNRALTVQDPVGDEAADGKRSSAAATGNKVEEVAVYTGQVYLGFDKYKVWQELGDGTMVKRPKTYKEGEQPILVQTYALLPREHYGRGLVEDFLGDFSAVEGLSKALVSMAAVMSRVVGLLNPGGVTRAKEINEAPNGTIVVGRRDDLQFVQVEKSGDMAGAKAVLDELVMRIRTAFLSSFAVRRQGERVTAEEIRMIAQQLEETLGGVYSTLTATLQQPLVRRIMAKLQNQPDHKDAFAIAEPVVVSGIEALGRQAEISRIATYAQVMTSLIGADRFSAMLEVGAVSRLVASSVGLSTPGLVKSDEQMAKEQQAQQQAAMQQEAMSAGVRGGAGPAAKAFVESQTQQPEAE